MPRKARIKSQLEKIAEVIEINALRIRLEIPSKRAARKTAKRELIVARDALQSEIEGL